MNHIIALIAVKWLLQYCTGPRSWEWEGGGGGGGGGEILAHLQVDKAAARGNISFQITNYNGHKASRM